MPLIGREIPLPPQIIRFECLENIDWRADLGTVVWAVPWGRQIVPAMEFGTNLFLGQNVPYEEYRQGSVTFNSSGFGLKAHLYVRWSPYLFENNQLIDTESGNVVGAAKATSSDGKDQSIAVAGGSSSYPIVGLVRDKASTRKSCRPAPWIEIGEIGEPALFLPRGLPYFSSAGGKKLVFVQWDRNFDWAANGTYTFCVVVRSEISDDALSVVNVMKCTMQDGLSEYGNDIDSNFSRQCNQLVGSTLVSGNSNSRTPTNGGSVNVAIDFNGQSEIRAVVTQTGARTCTETSHAESPANEGRIRTANVSQNGGPAWSLSISGGSTDSFDRLRMIRTFTYSFTSDSQQLGRSDD